jgi:hypothetical protein
MQRVPVKAFEFMIKLQVPISSLQMFEILAISLEEPVFRPASDIQKQTFFSEISFSIKL